MKSAPGCPFQLLLRHGGSFLGGALGAVLPLSNCLAISKQHLPLLLSELPGQKFPTVSERGLSSTRCPVRIIPPQMMFGAELPGLPGWRPLFSSELAIALLFTCACVPAYPELSLSSASPHPTIIATALRTTRRVTGAVLTLRVETPPSQQTCEAVAPSCAGGEGRLLCGRRGEGGEAGAHSHQVSCKLPAAASFPRHFTPVRLFQASWRDVSPPFPTSTHGRPGMEFLEFPAESLLGWIQPCVSPGRLEGC